MSRLAVVGGMAMRGLSVGKYSAPSGVVRPGRSLMSMNAVLVMKFTEEKRKTSIHLSVTTMH